MSRRKRARGKTVVNTAVPAALSNNPSTRLLLKNLAREHSIMNPIGKNNATLFDLINAKRIEKGKKKFTVEEINEKAKKMIL